MLTNLNTGLSSMSTLTGAARTDYALSLMDGRDPHGCKLIANALIAISTTSYDRVILLGNHRQLWLPIIDDVTVANFDIACMHGFIEPVKLFLEHDKPCSEQAIVHASTCGYLEIVQLLLCHGIIPQSEDALNSAAEHGHFNVVNFLLSSEYPYYSMSALVNSAHNGYTDIFQSLIEHLSKGKYTAVAKE